MAKWKLCRQTFGTETFTFSEGDEVSLGRGLNNTITLSSLVISRSHCLINFQRNQILITDLNSSNGIYVGTKRIPANVPYAIKESDVIGIGWTIGVPLGQVLDKEKFVFKIVKEPLSLINRITFQSDDEFDNIEEKIASLEETKIKSECFVEKEKTKPQLKRKIEFETESLPRIIDTNQIKKENKGLQHDEEQVVHIISDSETELNIEPPETVSKKPKLDTVHEEPHKETCKNQNGTTLNLKQPKCETVNEGQRENYKNKNEVTLKTENEYLEFEAFDVKQEYSGYDDEAISIDSDSDSESEHWYLRLSQSSPGKPFMKMQDKSIDTKPEDSSYSQMDDDLEGIAAFLNEDNDYEDEAISSPPQLPGEDNEISELEIPAEKNETVQRNANNAISLPFLLSDKQNEISELLIPAEKNKTVQRNANEAISLLSQLPVKQNEISELEILAEKNEIVQRNADVRKKDSDHIEKDFDALPSSTVCSGKDEIDGFTSKEALDVTTTTVTVLEAPAGKKTQMIEPLHLIKRKTSNATKPHTTQDNKSKKSSKYDKKSKNSSKTQISNSQKEERKRKLKELTKKGKEDSEPSSSKAADKQNSIKSVSHIKFTSSNRQAYLTNEPVGKPVKRKESPQKPKPDKANKETLSPEDVHKNKSIKQNDDIENDKTKKLENKEQKHDSSKSSKDSKCNGISNTIILESRIPLKSLKPLTGSENSTAQQLPREKQKRTVRFSEAPPEVHYFEIEPGNKMKKTSLVKTTLVDTRQMPSFSLERITLMKILRWNPHWLEEQINNNEPPPILGHNNLPLALFHSFSNHNQYVQSIGDLLLMEIWECLSIAYTKIRNQTVGMRMVIASLPPVPTQERFFDTFNLSVDVSVPTSEIKNLPRVGEILLVTFGPENARHQRFFFVHNVRCHPSPSTNRNAFYNISLQATFSDKMRSLKPGEVMISVRLAYINKELSLFESMAYMAGSPLSEAILRPEPRHFLRKNSSVSITNPWTMTLNSSQHEAVASSVSAAMGDRPCIQMVQGPPGTGKSSVICAIVMSYFYDANVKKQPNRGKILICATSNAAVDELVIRLLNIRQTLPTNERFRMVRVGRAEAMHARAREVSSQQLAQREAARAQHDPHCRLRPGLTQEISHLEAKINMWKSAAQDAAAKGQDPMRVAYCQGRITDLVKRIALLRGGGGGGDELRPEQLVHAERRYIEGADIVVTTLASAHNHKMKGLKRRIALCIVDEAGQAIEPEALIPLTLDVTRLTLIGDPQQLPGYICSQRAKKHGLGESLFSRLASCAEAWREGNPVVLLREQYRMHDHIADYPNRAFYAGLIRSVTRPRPDLPIPPYCIVGIASGDKGQNACGANEMEAWGVARLVVALGGLRARGLSLAVITPYNAHKELVKKNLKMLIDPADAQVEVNTVDSFQGQERDVVVVSLARSQGVGFLTDAGRMNVMLTRARHALLVCLNPHAVLKNHQWRTLLEDAHKRKLYRTLPNKMCQPTGLFSNEEILKHV